MAHGGERSLALIVISADEFEMLSSLSTAITPPRFIDSYSIILYYYYFLLLYKNFVNVWLVKAGLRVARQALALGL